MTEQLEQRPDWATAELLKGNVVSVEDINKRLSPLCQSLIERQKLHGIPQMIVMDYGKVPFQQPKSDACQTASKHHREMLLVKLKFHIEQLDMQTLADVIEVMILLAYREENKIINFDDIKKPLPQSFHEKASASWQLACAV